MPEQDAPGSPARSRGPFAPLAGARYRALWLATLSSNLGIYVQTVATSWSMVRLGAGADMIALVQTAANLPLMLFSILAGGLADMFDRRSVMIAAQTLMLVSSTMLAVMAFVGTLSAWQLLGFTFLIGCGNALYNPAWSASIRDVVPLPMVERAIALNIISNNAARSIGPAIGGVIVAATGTSAAFLTNAVSKVGLILILTRWRRATLPVPGPRHSFSLRGLIGGGLGYAVSERPIANLLIRNGMFMLGSAAIWSLMPVIARDRLAGGATTYGLLFGAFGVGAVGGALGSTAVRARLGVERLLAAGTVSFALASLVVALANTSVLLVPAHLLAGASWVMVLSSFQITLQLSAPRGIVGRLLALYQTISFGGLAIGSLIWGQVANVASTRVALLGATAVMAFALIFGLRRPVPRSVEVAAHRAVLDAAASAEP